MQLKVQLDVDTPNTFFSLIMLIAAIVHILENLECSGYFQSIAFLIGSPNINCSFDLAQLFLHSGRHSARDFCSAPLGFVHSYMHLERQASNDGSFLVPFKAGSTSAPADNGTKRHDEPMDSKEDRNFARDVESCS